MKTNHYKKKKLSKKKELVKRSASKYISFENRLPKETKKEIETFSKKVKSYGCCLKCYSEWKEIGWAKKDRSIKKIVKEQLADF